jgi:hypothetical protein
MNKLPKNSILTRSFLTTAGLAILVALGIIPVLGLGITGTTTTLPFGIASAQQQTTTTGGGGGNSTLYGILTSTQLNNQGAPEWLTAGSWRLVTDRPIFGGDNQTTPTVKSFDAVIVMTTVANGTRLHSHMVSNFKQGQVLHLAGNTTDINGTMTVTTEQGTTQNVPGFLNFQNNRMSIWINPGAIQNHFGPTPITGIIVSSPQQLQEIGRLLPPSLTQGVGQPSMNNGGTTSGGP